MKAIILSAYNNNLIRALIGLKLEDKPIPEPSERQVQIKIEAAPCNPSDIAFLRGGYNIKKSLPCIPGFEGCGVITKVGKGIKKALIGKRVSCFVQDNSVGTWSEYVVADITRCIFLKDEMPSDQAACFAVNPFTAYGLFNMAIENECDAIVQNAASGQVGCFVRVLAKKSGLHVINIVRKAEQIEQLMKEGAEYILNSSDENFVTDLTVLTNDLNARIAFDAVGGSMPALFLQAMPTDSEVVVYGGLSGLKITDIDPMGVIFDRKSISGFNLMDWMNNLEDSEYEEISNYLQKLFIEGTLKTKIQGHYSYEDVVNGIRSYIGNMAAGKILIG